MTDSRTRERRERPAPVWGDWDWGAVARPSADSPAPLPTGPSGAPRAPSPPPGPPRPRDAVVRRRRAVAALGLLALVVVVVVVGSGAASGGGQVSRTHHLRRGLRPHFLGPTPTQVANRAIARVLARTPVITQGGRQRREIALTFDDGPGPYTPALLKRLEELHAPATFFAVGSMERYFWPATVAEAHAGYPVANHTESHPVLASLAPSAQNQQIVAQTHELSQLNIPYLHLFRPPYGSYNQTTLGILARLGLLTVLWSTDTEDFRQPGASVIAARVLAGAHPGAIILMHDGGGVRTQTIAALATIVHRLRARHFQLVTVPRMLQTDPPPPQVQVPTNLGGG